MTDISSQALDALKAAVGPQGWLDDPDALAPYLTEWRGIYSGCTPLLVAPASTAEASAVLRVCAEHDIAVVPQGGNTGLAGGAIPGLQSRPEILLSSRRLNRVRNIDPANFTVTVEAGVVLAELQQRVAAQELYFPLSLAAEGSCQIGGNLSTNAGGTNVLRYGNSRDLVLGLEVVLPSGEVWDGLSGLRKDNTGYDLRHLFVGAEGTLGFITAATLKLFPAPRSRATAWLAVADPDAAVALYSAARRHLGEEMVAFELMAGNAVDMVLAHIPGTRAPLDAEAGGGQPPWCVLIEFTSAGEQAVLDAQLLSFLEQCMSDGLVADGAVAASDAQREDFWRVRHGISEAQKHAGGSIKHDVSVPVSRMA
ncbi:MAG: FAD-binding oxidoreductase, partial [Gammaproteobacteria bacterium]|nr:FAD-binding oxidoreductase [Gammaproteobacteria bacterium]